MITRTLSPREGTAVAVLAGISLSHLLNDTVQSLVPAIYPMLKAAFSAQLRPDRADHARKQLTASLLQPLVGLYTDRRPLPYSLVGRHGLHARLACCCCRRRRSFGLILAAAVLMGIGSAVFHPESSRVARMASGGRHGLAQSVFQVGGNIGTSFGPLLAPSSCCRVGRRASRGAPCWPSRG